jgi:hypothetical protein
MQVRRRSRSTSGPEGTCRYEGGPLRYRRVAVSVRTSTELRVVERRSGMQCSISNAQRERSLRYSATAPSRLVVGQLVGTRPEPWNERLALQGV